MVTDWLLLSSHLSEAAELISVLVLLTVSLAGALVVSDSITGVSKVTVAVVELPTAVAVTVVEVVVDGLPETVDAVEVGAVEVALDELALAGAMPLEVEAVEVVAVEVGVVEVEAVEEMSVLVILGTAVVEELALLVTVTLLVLNE